jgi:hypothetical protein
VPLKGTEGPEPLTTVILRNFYNLLLETELIVDAFKAHGFGWICVQVTGICKEGKNSYNLILVATRR